MFKIFKNKSKKQTEYLAETDLETIEGYFKMLDVTKFLKYNAMSVEQFNNAIRMELSIKSILKELAVPQKHN